MPQWLAQRQDRQVFYAVREHPIEMAVATAAVVGSTYTLVTSTYPTSIRTLLEPPWQFVWNSYLLLGGLMILVGLSLSTNSMQTRGTPLEKAGLLSVGVGSFVYSFSIMATLGVQSPFIILMLLVIPMAFYLRVKQIDRLIDSNKALVREAQGARDAS